MNTVEKSRWGEIVSLWKTYPPMFVIAGFLAGLLFFPAVQLVTNDFSGLLHNLVPEAFGIAFTVFLIDRLYEIREQRRQVQDLKEILIREAGSPSNTVSIHAIKELRNRNWLAGEYGLLRTQDLSDADLSKAKLAKANLYQTDFWYADLSEANLYMADLRKAEFWRAKLAKANLKWADMKNSILVGADLRGANLRWCNLSGAMLRGYSLNSQEFVYFEPEWDDRIWQQHIRPDSKPFSAVFDTDTILPDGNNWTPHTDMRRYTWSEHPEFWNSKVDEQGNPLWWLQNSDMDVYG